MRTIYKFLFLELFKNSLITTTILTFFLVIANAFRDLSDLLVNNEVPLWISLKLLLSLIPFVLTFTLPWGLLIAVILLFGKMSQDRELIALKSAGISIGAVMAPIIWFALLYSIFSFAINAYIGPKSRHAFKEIFSDVMLHNPLSFFKSSKTIDQFDGFRLYANNRIGARLQDVYIWETDAELRPLRSIRASEADIEPDLAHQRILLTLWNARQEERNIADPQNVKLVMPGSRATQLPYEISLATLFDRLAVRKSIGLSTLDEIGRQIVAADLFGFTSNPTPVLTEFQKRLAFSLSCFTFVLVGAPLAIQVQRKETSIGVALSLFIVLSYYVIVLLADALKAKTNFFPELIIWLPNIIFQTLGFWLIWRVNRK
ncbi:permease [Methylacidiphilum kamchatkense Kam1]|uniref:Permease n=1 Tax=Methylacidiphilum kamchatkense Kam1 TaxID=1202785 RepID=A0A0C1RLI0_9BACT|nr:LptF/LptG family permease [Methylacidiphilum kamchatkense]KIE58912.1 permease [Methylacidiphilum kamchatkense Kam1]QDQ43211.1 lipopolysaccharide export system permease protein [Methylacidiphilum kamchatkense Kam1]